MIEEEHSCGVIPLKVENDQVFVLVVLHKGGKHWGFPKGHKDPGETDLETAERELHEETGLTLVRCLSEVPYQERYKFYKLKKRVCKKVTYFACLVEGTLALQEEEIIGAQWIPIEKAEDFLTFKEARDICKKVQTLL